MNAASTGTLQPGLQAWHVARTLRALELLSIQPRSAPELADELQVHVRTARRVLARLEAEGYATVANGPRRRWSPTLRVVALAGQVLDSAELIHHAREPLATLAAGLGMNVQLCVPGYLSAVCVLQLPPDPDDPPASHVGHQLPCHCTAAGKTLAAWRPAWQAAITKLPRPAFTTSTIVGVDYLARELQHTRVRGYAIEDREHHLDTRAIAAPVQLGGHQAGAAITAKAPARRLPAHSYPPIAAAVRDTAARIGATLA